ncbi:MAG: acetylglutamate kinase [Myxococcales bacterium]|nr:acetylglutamate kinase [Myxococcales bacterium]
MKESVVGVVLDLSAGEDEATAFGCDLSFDYVKINADYLGVISAPPAEEVPLHEQTPDNKRRVLVEALRYIDRFNGIRAVIKLGGAAMVEPGLEKQFAESVLLLRNAGLLPIVVHGGGPEISRTLRALGQTPEFVDGLRVTDSESMAVVEMVLTGGVNQRLVAALNERGGRAVGLSGKDGGFIRAKKLVSSRDLGQVGDVDEVDPTLVELLESRGYVPVISPVGLGAGGSSFNINADVVAARVAASVRASKLIYMSDVPGLLEPDGSVVSELTQDQLKQRLERGDITGGMKPKLEAALEALRHGVASVHLVDGRVPYNLIAELFTDRGVGTLIRQS